MTFSDKLSFLGHESLSQEALSQLHNHSIFRWAQTVPNQGQGITFQIARGFIKGGAIRSDLKGEARQGLFIKVLLEQLFPRAEILTTPEKLEGRAKLIQVWLQDFAESPRAPQKIPPQAFLNMPIIKAGNPGLIRFDKQKARSYLGIPAERKILSLYLVNEREFDDPKFQTIVSSLVERYHFTDIFVSISIPGRSYVLDAHQRYLTENTDLSLLFEHFVFLTKFSPEHAPEGRRWIYNNKTGNMPQIHGIADLAVVFGPINFFEPLNMGTKTLLVRSNPVRGKYSDQALYRMIHKASASPGFLYVNSAKQLTNSIDSLLDGPNPSSPALLKKNALAPTPFEITLNHLKKLITTQYGSSKEVDRFDER
jgi:hypothetical protein